MKQIISVLLILLCVCVFAQEGERRGPIPDGMMGRENPMNAPNRMNGMPRQIGLIFGIPYSKYDKLGISKEVQAKIDGLQKEYNEKYMRRLDMIQRNRDGKKFTEEEIDKQREEAKKAEEKLYADFKALLTPEQLKAYETAYEEQLENYRQAITKEYNALNEKLKFTEEQNKKIFNFINEFKGNPAEFHQGFSKLLGDIMPRQMGQIFGIPYSEYEKLGISEEVQAKIDGLQKEYNEKYMRRPDMIQRNRDGKKFTEEEIAKQREEAEKLREEAKKAEEKLYADFKALLTPEQLKAYETAYEEQLENYRQAITKEYNALNEKLKFTEEQNKKIFDFINEFKGNPAEFYQGFIKLLDNIMTEEQKTAYQAYQKEKMEEMRKQMNRQGGNKRQGNRLQRGRRQRNSDQ